MQAICYNTAQANLANTLRQVCENHEPVIITREMEEAVVLMSLDDYNSLEETAYLLRSPTNAKRLIESIAELEAGGGTERDLIG